MKAQWDEITAYRHIPSCTCPYSYICVAMRSARNYILEDQVIQFLIFLNDLFSVVKTQMLLMDSLSSINKFYYLVAQEDSNNVHALVVDESTVITSAYDAKKSYGRSKGINNEGTHRNNTRYRTYCYKYGHPEVNKPISYDNTYKNNANESHQHNSYLNQQEPNVSGLTQEKYDHPVCLLPSANLDIGSNSNQLNTYISYYHG